MALNLQQLQKQTQRLIMTPQMQQSIQLLQLNAIELEQMAQQELLENPFLTLEEERQASSEPGDSSDDPQLDQAEAQRQAEPTSEPDAVEDGFESFADGGPEGAGDSSAGAEGTDGPQANGESAGSPASETMAQAPSELDIEPSEAPPIDATPEKFEEVDLNWDEFYSDSESPTYSSTREDTEERDFSEYVAAKTSLYDYLNWQLRCSVLDGLDTQICEYLIGNLNDDGYLPPESVQEAAEVFNAELAQVERVLSILQEFDPPGIAARSLTECLLIQMKALGSYSELAQQVLEHHMVEFQKKKFRELARQVGVDEETLLGLYHKVCRLEPHPGRSMSCDSVQYIQPDVYVKIIDGELLIFLNEGQAGRLSVDRFYHRLIKQQRSAMTPKEKEYALEKYRSALTLIKNIEKRKSTILRVTESIMEVQRAFLDKGIEFLKPLTLREVADMVGMHESTVARVTSRKYVETPQGTYPLKYFFSSSIDSTAGDGDAVSSRSIKEKLDQIINSENQKKPFSDQKIAEILNKQGFDIARRTVAKYREQLKILPAKYRRQT